MMMRSIISLASLAASALSMPSMISLTSAASVLASVASSYLAPVQSTLIDSLDLFDVKSFAAVKDNNSTSTTTTSSSRQSFRCPSVLISEFEKVIGQPCLLLPPLGSFDEWRRCMNRRRQAQHQFNLCSAEESFRFPYTESLKNSSHIIDIAQDDAAASSTAAGTRTGASIIDDQLLNPRMAAVSTGAASTTAAEVEGFDVHQSSADDRFTHLPGCERIRYCIRSLCPDQRSCSLLPTALLPLHGECSPALQQGRSFQAQVHSAACRVDADALLAIRYRNDPCSARPVCRAYNIKCLSDALIERRREGRCESFESSDRISMMTMSTGTVLSEVGQPVVIQPKPSNQSVVRVPISRIPRELLPRHGVCSPQSATGESESAQITRAACIDDVQSFRSIQFHLDNCEPRVVCFALTITCVSADEKEARRQSRCRYFNPRPTQARSRSMMASEAESPNSESFEDELILSPVDLEIEFEEFDDHHSFTDSQFELHQSPVCSADRIAALKRRANIKCPIFIGRVTCAKRKQRSKDFLAVLLEQNVDSFIANIQHRSANQTSNRL